MPPARTHILQKMVYRTYVQVDGGIWKNENIRTIKKRKGEQFIDDEYKRTYMCVLNDCEYDFLTFFETYDKGFTKNDTKKGK